jgi:asparagine synthase (glutamine-hydrolysing)
MSGFVALVNLDGAPADAVWLRRRARSMAERGPDGVTTRCQGPAALGHALLRTTSDRDETGLASLGDLWITADVRLDARDELVAQLESERGRRLRTESDAELILHLYAERGEAGLTRLVGDFAFAIWDARRRVLVVARDPFGVKPVFYAQFGRSLLVASTIDAVRAHPRVAGELDESAVGDFLVIGENPHADRTLLRGVRRLPPAHRLVATRDGVHTRRYWALSTREDIRYARGEDYVEHFSELFRAAVSDRLPDGRASILMSGGLDSPSVAAMAREARAARGAQHGLLACTAVYERLVPDAEGAYARSAARHLGIPIRTFPADDDELYATLDRGPAASPQPAIHPFEDGALYRAAADHGRVILTGYGADPAFRASPFYLARLLRRGHVARVARETARHLADFHRPPSVGARTFWRRLRRDALGGFPDWIASDFAAAHGLRERWRASQSLPASADGVHATRPEAHAMLQAVSWPNHFEDLDTANTELHLEFRHPFFDVRLLRFVMGIPAIPWCVHKEILRRAMRSRLPEAVRTRPKTPLAGHPVHAFPPERFRMLAGRLRSAPGLGRFVRVAALVEALAAREQMNPLALHAAFPAIGLAEWLRARSLAGVDRGERSPRPGPEREEWIDERPRA